MSISSIIFISLAWLLMSLFFSLFIVWFNRKSMVSVKMGFAYVGVFFVAGIAILFLSLLVM